MPMFRRREYAARLMFLDTLMLRGTYAMLRAMRAMAAQALMAAQRASCAQRCSTSSAAVRRGVARFSSERSRCQPQQQHSSAHTLMRHAIPPAVADT